MKLALGTVQFGVAYGIANTSGRISLDCAAQVLKLARRSGIDTLDTAIAYGDSESVLGSSGVSNWKIVSKLPAFPESCACIRAWVDDQVEGSLQRLGIHRIYGLLLHRPSQLLGRQGRELYQAIEQLKTGGLVEKIGISVYGPEELAQLFDLFKFDLVQAPLNILDRNLVESGWASKLKQAGIELHTRSAFLQGLLLMPANERPLAFHRWSNIWTEWDRWLATEDLTPLQACLRYVNSISDVDRLVVGVDATEHLQQILSAMQGELQSLPRFEKLLDQRLINPASWNQL